MNLCPEGLAQELEYARYNSHIKVTTYCFKLMVHIFSFLEVFVNISVFVLRALSLIGSFLVFSYRFL